MAEMAEMAEGTGGEIVEFQEVARHWKRMCKQFQKPNTCHGCPIAEHQKMFEACSDGDVDTVAMEALVMAWAAENPEPQYPTWTEWLSKQGFVELKVGQFVKRTENEYIYECKTVAVLTDKAAVPIPADIAQKLGIEPKEDA